MNTESELYYPLKEILETIRLNNGAWSITYTALWPGQQLDSKELQTAWTFIYAYFDNADDRSKAFIDFCQRILLMRNYLKSKNIAIPQPSDWFDPEYTHGFYASGKILSGVNNRRRQAPKYLKHYIIAAGQYLRLVLRPKARIFRACNNGLLSLHAPVLCEQFRNAILHFNYKNQ